MLTTVAGNLIAVYCAAIAPKCVVVIDHYDWEDDAPPRTPWGLSLIHI